MNIQEYISSGIVESYVLGLADDAERAEFEQMCTLHPEVLAAREAFEIQLENHAIAAAEPPAENLRQVVLEQIFTEPVVQTNGHTNRAVAPARVIPMAMRFAAAAIIVLLAGSAILNIYYFNKYREYSRRYDRLVAQQTELVKNNNTLQTKLNTYQNTIAGLSNPNMAVVKMMGHDVPSNGSPAPASMATVYWDTQSKDVYLMANNLPKPAAGKQYQLWAIVDNKPVDAGLLDMDKEHLLVKMKNIPRAQLFAITLEQKGGSPIPQGPMYVMGKV